MSSKVEIVRSNDLRCQELEAEGYEVVGTSWGAHLTFTDQFNIANLDTRINEASQKGYRFELLHAGFAQQILELEVLNNPHYPYTPATSQPMPTVQSTRALFLPNSWNFGALLNNELVGVCATSKKATSTELDFGSVHPDHRGKGVGIGVAAYALKTLIQLGETKFGTGGAEINSASRATVEKLGFSIDEIWYSYQIYNQDNLNQQ